MMRVRGLSIGAAVVIASLVLVVPAGFAALTGHRVYGTIQSVGAGSLTVTSRDGQSTVVKETAETKIIERRKGTIADIRQGDSVRVIARQAADGALTAVAIESGRFDLLPQRGGKTTKPNGTATPPVVVTGRVSRLDGTGATRTLAVNYVNGTATITAPETVRVSRVELLQPASLKAGMRVSVSGSDNPDGSITAATIMVGGIHRQ